VAEEEEEEEEGRATRIVSPRSDFLSFLRVIYHMKLEKMRGDFKRTKKKKECTLVGHFYLPGYMFLSVFSS